MRIAAKASRAAAAALCIASLALGASAGFAQTAPAASVPAPASASAPANDTGYVRILPLPAGGSLHDIFVRDGKLVGAPVPFMDTTRVLRGDPIAAEDLLKTLTSGAKRVPSPAGRAYRRADGAEITYFEVSARGLHGPRSITTWAEILIQNAGDLPVTRLLFASPHVHVDCVPKPGHACPSFVSDGGGGM